MAAIRSLTLGIFVALAAAVLSGCPAEEEPSRADYETAISAAALEYRTRVLDLDATLRTGTDAVRTGELEDKLEALTSAAQELERMKSPAPVEGAHSELAESARALTSKLAAIVSDAHESRVGALVDLATLGESRAANRYARALAALEARGFDVTDWPPGAVPPTS